MPTEHITICICTYKRPVLLAKLLEKIGELEVSPSFHFSVVIVDNDCEKTAEKVVLDHKKKAGYEITYAVEPEANIALARNRAVSLAKGDYYAFIDDDEFPIPEWLVLLYSTLKNYDADAVLGPVCPFFEVTPPKWIIKGGLLERERYNTGKVILKSSDTRTGNVLINKKWFEEKEQPFNSSCGKTGGEDVDFFKGIMANGAKIIWCDEAVAYESVPPERCRSSYFLRRAMLRGVCNAKDIKFFSSSTALSITALVIYTVAVPFYSLLGRHILIKLLIKGSQHLSKVLALMGIKLVKERDF